jgi:integrase/recombinase XerD
MHAHVRAALERLGAKGDGRVLLDMESPGKRLRGFWRGLDLRDVDLYTLRHDFATQLLKHGADINVVKELLGHRDIKTTSRYLTATAARTRAAVKRLT